MTFHKRSSFSDQGFLRVFANDYDADENARVTFDLPDSADNQYFGIDGVSGTISNRREFDRETRDRYIIEVEAQDNPISEQPNIGTTLSVFLELVEN